MDNEFFRLNEKQIELVKKYLDKLKFAISETMSEGVKVLTVHQMNQLINVLMIESCSSVIGMNIALGHHDFKTDEECIDEICKVVKKKVMEELPEFEEIKDDIQSRRSDSKEH